MANDELEVQFTNTGVSVSYSYSHLQFMTRSPFVVVVCLFFTSTGLKYLSFFLFFLFPLHQIPVLCILLEIVLFVYGFSAHTRNKYNKAEKLRQAHVNYNKFNCYIINDHNKKLPLVWWLKFLNWIELCTICSKVRNQEYLFENIVEFTIIITDG